MADDFGSWAAAPRFRWRKQTSGQIPGSDVRLYKPVLEQLWMTVDGDEQKFEWREVPTVEEDAPMDKLD